MQVTAHIVQEEGQTLTELADGARDRSPLVAAEKAGLCFSSLSATVQCGPCQVYCQSVEELLEGRAQRRVIGRHQARPLGAVGQVH